MNQTIKIIGAALLSATLFFTPAFSQKENDKIPSTPYHWKSVQIVGGGFVDGIIFHPKAKGVGYCRTDMGGAYRWNDVDKRWEPLLDFLSYEDRNLMGVESIALDPNDAGFVIIACGTYTNPMAGNGAIFRSFNSGKTFLRTDVLFKFGGNENGRGNGERMSVDPANGNIIYLGTRLNGLWKSTDKGATWNPVKSFPDLTEKVTVPAADETVQQRRARFQNRGAGVVVTLFDAAKNVSSKFSTVYVAASLMDRNNFFRSTDDGARWQPVSGQPTQYRPTHAVLSSDGMIYLTYGDNPGPGKMTNGAVWKFNTATGEWADITPDKPDAAAGRAFGYAAVSVDAQNPGTLMVSSFNRYTVGGEELFRSRDAGKTWVQVFKTGTRFDSSLAPYTIRTGVHWMFDIEIDPCDSNHAMFTTGYGGHETHDLTNVDNGKITDWQVMATGIEETVALELLSPPKGAQLITAIGDYGGFVHFNLDKPAPEGNFTNPHFLNTDGLACAENNPAVIVRVGEASHGVQGQNIGYSLDAGKSWQLAPAMPQPNSMHGHIAVSADGNTWIWAPERIPVYVTHDHGKSWQPAKGIADNLKVIADKVNPKKFYALDLQQGKLYTSTDEGNSFTERALDSAVKVPKWGSKHGDNRGGQDRVYATPGREEDLWLAAFDGLYHSAGAGKSFSKMRGAAEIHAFGFGKAAPGEIYPALYLVGIVNGVRGFFRSDDMAQNWVRINDDLHQYGLVLHISGDPKKYGRVYVGTHGRGVLYGDPVN